MRQRTTWDQHDVRVAVAQIQGLVDGFSRDLSGAGFRAELEKVVGEAFPAGAEPNPDGRVALLLYGAAIVGAAGLSLATELALGREDRDDVRAMIGDAVNAWLDSA
jgi:hypothetical protein